MCFLLLLWILKGDPVRLAHKVAILTASAGAGIGQATARAIASEGAHVVIADIHEDRSQSVAENIRNE